MSQENVDLVRASNAAFRRGDWDGVAAGMDPDILLRTDPRRPEQGMFGREAALAFYRDLSDTMGSEINYDEVVDLGDRVLVTARWATSGQTGDIGEEGPLAILVTVRERRIILEEFFLDPADARRAVGIPG